MAKLIVGVNDFATVNPELAMEWHPTKNGDLKPCDVSAGSGKKYGGSVKRVMSGEYLLIIELMVLIALYAVNLTLKSGLVIIWRNSAMNSKSRLSLMV